MVVAEKAGSSLAGAAKRAAISYAKRTVSNAFDNRNFDGPRLDSFHVQTSRDGASMPRIYGRVRIAGHTGLRGESRRRLYPFQDECHELRVRGGRERGPGPGGSNRSLARGCGRHT